MTITGMCRFALLAQCNIVGVLHLSLMYVDIRNMGMTCDLRLFDEQVLTISNSEADVVETSTFVKGTGTADGYVGTDKSFEALIKVSFNKDVNTFDIVETNMAVAVSPTVRPTPAPSFSPTITAMPTVNLDVMYTVVDKHHSPLQYECIDLNAHGSLVKITIDMDMQMTGSSWASDFFISVSDSVDQFGWQVGGFLFTYPPNIAHHVNWHSSLNYAANGPVSSFVEIGPFTVKASDRLCYGNGYGSGSAAKYSGTIILSELTEQNTNNAPTISPTSSQVCKARPNQLGNGICNKNYKKNNMEECGWDGGDCCEESCKMNAKPRKAKKCGSRGYYCLDPSYDVCGAKFKQLGNGICNLKNNKAECGWDGGDCCEETCTNNPNPKKAAKCGNARYQCLDPAHKCTASPKQLGNGKCSRKHNKADCGWDGGDCCKESCMSNANPFLVKRCGTQGYQCLDPEYSTN